MRVTYLFGTYVVVSAECCRKKEGKKGRKRDREGGFQHLA